MVNFQTTSLWVRFLIILGITASFFMTTSCEHRPDMLHPEYLLCEHLPTPLGIDTQSPRFSWRLDKNDRNTKQTAYRILVSTDSIQASQRKGDVWDSGKIDGSDMLVVYRGDSLKPFTRYYWNVQLWNEGTESPVSPITSFETGMMKTSNWKGDWITDTADVNLKPAPYFRKAFSLSKKIKEARVYVVAAGLYELSINGHRVGDHRLDPMYTRFDKRNLYVTYDVTANVSEGPNTIGVLLGNGWYNHQSTAVWDFHKAHWRNRPRFCVNLRIEFDDGTVETITTGPDWKTSLSPVIFNSIYTAEHYDARKEQTGWNTNEFNDSSWRAAVPVKAPSELIVAQMLYPIRYVEEIQPVKFTRINDKKYLFDLGRNIAGISRIVVKGDAGTQLRLRHAEILDSAGNIDMSNIDVHYRPTDDTDPFQTDIFILKGQGEETFSPTFNYKGFQYVEVTSDRPITLQKESLVGIFMHSDVPRVGSITSSSDVINKIWAATNNSYLSNLFGYPTDCPQREKNGWTGDAHIASETGLYNFDGITIYEKWLADHRDEQQPNGILPSIIPTAGWGYEWGNGPDWTSTIAIIPWNIYLFYGDQKILEDSYSSMKKYVDHITEISPTGLTDWGLGDWVPVKSVTPKELTSSLYYYADASIMAKTARLLKKNDDETKYTQLSKKIADAINSKYLNKDTGIYGRGFQTELSAPLFWGIVPEDIKPKVIDNLVKRVESDNRHIDVGLLGTKTILNALSENGHADLAFALASNETFPSWGYWIRNGATTLYENWPIHAKSDISRNHIMFGEIGAWLYKGPGGIKPDVERPGFKNVILEPHFVKGLDSFTATHQGPYGEIISSWKRSEKGYTYTASIPLNSTATLLLSGNVSEKTTNGVAIPPGDNITLQLPAGDYIFDIQN